MEFKIPRNMPDESCRMCGGLLLDYKLCAKCKAATQFMCRICGETTIERSHDYFCFRIDEEGAPKVFGSFQNLLKNKEPYSYQN